MSKATAEHHRKIAAEMLTLPAKPRQPIQTGLPVSFSPGLPAHSQRATCHGSCLRQACPALTRAVLQATSFVEYAYPGNVLATMGCGHRQQSNTFASKLNQDSPHSLNCLLKGCEIHKGSNTFVSKPNKHTLIVLL